MKRGAGRGHRISPLTDRSLITKTEKQKNPVEESGELLPNPAIQIISDYETH